MASLYCSSLKWSCRFEHKLWQYAGSLRGSPGPHRWPRKAPGSCHSRPSKSTQRLVGQVHHVGGVQLPHPAVVLQGRVTVFLLIGIVAQLLFFQGLFFFILGAIFPHGLGFGLLFGRPGGGGGTTSSSSSILPRSTPRSTLRVVMMQGSWSFMPRSKGLLRSSSISSR